MLEAERTSTLSAIFRQCCPRCRVGKIFHASSFPRLPRMHQQCPSCGLRFEREEGYFLGAMYIGYLLGLVLIGVFALVLWAAVHLNLYRSFVWSSVLFLPFVVPLTFLARVLWIYLDQAIDPER